MIVYELNAAGIIGVVLGQQELRVGQVTAGCAEEADPRIALPSHASSISITDSSYALSVSAELAVVAAGEVLTAHTGAGAIRRRSNSTHAGNAVAKPSIVLRGI